MTYSFEHDDLGRQTKVKVGTRELSANTYNAGAQTLANVTYGNGGKVSYEYDQFKRVTGVKYDDESANRFEYEYGADGRVAYVKDTNLKRTVWTERDLADRPARLHIMNTDDGSVVYRTKLAYDNYNNLSEFKEDVGGSEYATTYTYDSDNRPTAVKFGTDTEKVVYTYDELGRMATRKQYNGSSSTVRNSATYSYLAGSQSASGYTSCTPLVSGINQTGIDFSYGYEAKTANITSEARTGGSYGGTTTYAYDSMGQLVRVNDPVENATWVYTYDLGGNILNKKKYVYTTGTVGSVQQTIPYTYGDTNWKDKLTKYNGVTLTYDDMGNVTHDGTWTYAWAADRQLSGMRKSGTSAEFDYDHSGLRVKKKVGTTETNYTLNGKLVVHLTKDSDWMHFYYDAQGRPAMVNFNGTKYHYLHNLQCDIVGIVDASGTIVVEYKYDTWGKIIGRTGSLASTLGYLNPFRYRGYVYDEETGLYYLRSRYYNPEWGRFVNADIWVVSGNDLHSVNMYAYCLNNVINGIDSNEMAWLQAILNWTSQQIVRPIVNSIEAIVGDVDMTITVGFSASVSLGFWSYSASAGISINFEGNMGVNVSVATAITTGDASASINGFMTVTNAPTIKALEGESTQVGVSGAFGGSVSVDGVAFTSDGTDYFGLSVAVGYGNAEAGGTCYNS